MTQEEKVARVLALVEVMRDDVQGLMERVNKVERWMHIQLGASLILGGATGYVATIMQNL